MVLFDRTLTADERRQVEEDLRLTWGAALVPGAPTGVTAARATGADPLEIVADPATSTVSTMNHGADSVWRFSR